jgi:DNA repair protein RadC
MSIADWPAEERPREKLLACGADALSNAELLAIYLRTGVIRKKHS